MPRHLLHRKRRSRLIGFGVLGSVTAVGVWILADLSFKLTERVPIHSRTAWPDELVDMIHVGKAETADIRVAALGGFIDSQHAWQMKLTDSQWVRIIDAFGFQKIENIETDDSTWRRFPGWWPKRKFDTLVHYKTSGFDVSQRGADGFYYYAIWQNESRSLNVWYKFNF